MATKKELSPALIIYHVFLAVSSSFLNFLLFFRRSVARYHVFYAFFDLLARNHDHMIAAAALKPEIDPDP